MSFYSSIRQSRNIFSFGSSNFYIYSNDPQFISNASRQLVGIKCLTIYLTSIFTAVFQLCKFGYYSVCPTPLLQSIHNNIHPFSINHSCSYVFPFFIPNLAFPLIFQTQFLRMCTLRLILSLTHKHLPNRCKSLLTNTNAYYTLILEKKRKILCLSPSLSKDLIRTTTAWTYFLYKFSEKLLQLLFYLPAHCDQITPLKM